MDSSPFFGALKKRAASSLNALDWNDSCSDITILVGTPGQAATLLNRGLDEPASTGVSEATNDELKAGDIPPLSADESGLAPHRASPSGSDLVPGQRVGDYIVRSHLARGGFGAVYRAEHVEGGGPRALKVLHADLASTREVVLRFRREVEAIRRVPHPNVIAIESVGQLDDGRPYFVMELLEGVDLAAHLASVGRLSPGEATAVLEPLASALDAVHARGVIHRDLKPSNVFLDQRGGERRVILLDFGVAKLLDDRGPGLTASLQMIGTPMFMAPEQIRGLPADVRTDVYALGALLFCMLAGEPPFSAPHDVLGQLHLHVKPPRLSSRAPIGPALDDVVLRAMSKDPARRHPSAGALLDEVRRALGSAAPAPERRAAAVYVGASADEAALDDPSDGLLADLDAVLPRASALLAARGLRPALELGNGALFLLDLPEGAAAEEAARRDLVASALDLYRALERRPGRDDHVRVVLCVHAGPVTRDDRGAPGGPLLDLASWVPEPLPSGVLATEAALSGLGQPAELQTHGSLRVLSSSG